MIKPLSFVVVYNCYIDYRAVMTKWLQSRNASREYLHDQQPPPRPSQQLSLRATAIHGEAHNNSGSGTVKSESQLQS